MMIDDDMGMDQVTYEFYHMLGAISIDEPAILGYLGYQLFDP